MKRVVVNRNRAAVEHEQGLISGDEIADIRYAFHNTVEPLRLSHERVQIEGEHDLGRVGMRHTSSLSRGQRTEMARDIRCVTSFFGVDGLDDVEPFIANAGQDADRPQQAGGVVNQEQERAISLCRKAVELAPEKEEVRYDLARMLLQAGRDEESLPIFEQVFREHPVWVEITKRYVMSGELPIDPGRIQRVLAKARVREEKR